MGVGCRLALRFVYKGACAFAGRLRNILAHRTARYYVWRVWCVSSKSFAWTVAIVSIGLVSAENWQVLTSVCRLSPPLHVSVSAICGIIYQSTHAVWDGRFVAFGVGMLRTSHATYFLADGLSQARRS